VRSTEEVSELARMWREPWRVTVIVLPLATREEVDDEAERRDSCLSAVEADGHKAICKTRVSRCIDSGWVVAFVPGRRERP
jgi:hypothetical protein